MTTPGPVDPLAPPHPTRIAVVGTGAVGSTFAFALLLSGLASEIVLSDANERRAEGEAMDLMHAVPFARTARVWSGPVEECRGAAVTVVAAGAAQKPGETRLDLVTKNAAIFRDLVPRIAAANPDGIILVATNPVDILAYLAYRISGLPAERVIGSGTILDTARFRMLLAERHGVDPRSVHAHVSGEHGDSEVAVWSSANIAGMPLARLRGDDRHRAGRRGPRRDRVGDPQRGLPDHRAQGRDVLRGGGRAGADRRGRPARPAHRPVGELADLATTTGSTTSTCRCRRSWAGAGIERTLRLELSAEEASGLRRSAGLLRETIGAIGL